MTTPNASVTKRLKAYTSGVSGGQKEVRRSVTISEDNHKLITKVRGRFMDGMELDVDYTTTLNMFLEIGLKKLIEGQLSDKDKEIMNSYIANEEIREEGKIDEFVDIYNKRRLADYEYLTAQLARQAKKRAKKKAEKERQEREKSTDIPKGEGHHEIA